MDGLRFGRFGTVVSEAVVPPSTTGGRTLEFRAEPRVTEDSNTFLAFYNPIESRNFSIHQSEADLELRVASSSAWRPASISRLYIPDAFRVRKPSFWAIIAGPSGTSIFRDGGYVAKIPKAFISQKEFSGRVVIGTSPAFNDPWLGVVTGIAVYDRELTFREIERHERTWIASERPDLQPTDNCKMLYLFNERGGSVVHNRVADRPDLDIPVNYSILNQTLLDPVWRAASWSRSFWTDMFINIVGLIPFGFLYSSYFFGIGFHRPRLAASVFGVMISLFIEIVQSHLPTRDSSMSDVIGNAAGTFLGAWLYRGTAAQVVDQALNRLAHR